MIRFLEQLSEQEVGVRAARERLPALLSTVEQGHHVIHMTRHKKRIAALISADVAEGILASQGSESLAIPGDLAGAIKMVESLLIQDEDGPGPNLKAINSKRHELVGAVITLVDTLLPAPALGFGKLVVYNDDGTAETKMVADLLVRKLYKRPEIQAIEPSPIPIIAGCLWSSQIGDSAVDYRRMVPLAITALEGLAWIIALWELCVLINVIHGDGTAENLMYEIEEHIRETFSGSEWDTD